jgi:hypothetical protein
MSFETDDERRLKRQRLACDLAIAASRLRDADDALVAHGREIRDGDAGRGMPGDAEGERSVELCNGVLEAYAAMSDAEAHYEQTRVQS